MSDAIDVVLFLYLSTPVTKPTDNYARTENPTRTEETGDEGKSTAIVHGAREREEKRTTGSRRRRRQVMYVAITYDSFHALTGKR